MGGGGNGYRAVAYFVNVSALPKNYKFVLTTFNSGISVKELRKGTSQEGADCAQGYIWEKP